MLHISSDLLCRGAPRFSGVILLRRTHVMDKKQLYCPRKHTLSLQSIASTSILAAPAFQ